MICAARSRGSDLNQMIRAPDVQTLIKRFALRAPDVQNLIKWFALRAPDVQILIK